MEDGLYALDALNRQASTSLPAAEGVTAELHQTLDRARNERFRLIRLLKDCRSHRASHPVTPGTEKITQLAAKIQALDTAIKQRFARLDETEATIDKRLDQLGRLEASIRDLTSRFATQVTKARDFDHDLEATKDKMRLAADTIAQEHTEVLAKQAEAVIDAISSHLERSQDQLRQDATNLDNQLNRTFDERRQTLYAEADRAVDALARSTDTRLSEAMGAADQQADQLAVAFDGRLIEVRNSAEQNLNTLLDDVEQHIEQALVETRRRAETIINPMTDAFEQYHHNRMGSLTSQARDAFTDQSRHLDAQVNETAAKIEGHFNAIAERFENDAGSALRALDLKGLKSQAQQVALEAAERFIRPQHSQLDHRLGKPGESLPQSMGHEQDSKGALVSAMHDAEQSLREHIKHMKDEITATIAPLRRQVMDQLQQLAGQSHAPRPAVRPATDGARDPDVKTTGKSTGPAPEHDAPLRHTDVGVADPFHHSITQPPATETRVRIPQTHSWRL